MKSRSRLLVLPILVSLLLTPFNSFAQSGQQAQPFEPFVTRIREGLKLNEEQVGQLRLVLAKHEPKITELRRRAQATPYTRSCHLKAIAPSRTDSLNNLQGSFRSKPRLNQTRRPFVAA